MSSKVQFTKRKTTSLIVIHCAATRPSMDVGIREIRQWHKARGFLDVGYHFIIRRDGTVEAGRDQEQVGAHAKGHNSTSVSVCLVGGVDDKLKPEDNFTDEQWVTLAHVVKSLQADYPEAKVVGHTDLDSGKACPSFKVAPWLASLT